MANYATFPKSLRYSWKARVGSCVKAKQHQGTFLKLLFMWCSDKFYHEVPLEIQEGFR